MAVLTELNLYPIKSCAGISLRSAVLTPAGLSHEQVYDREWMVIDEDGMFLTQRELPRMALITPRIKAETLELRAPGMLRLEVPLGLPAPEDERTRRVKVWDDTVMAYDCDEVTATWFSKFLGRPARLVRFHPDAKRPSNPDWVGELDAPKLFADGYPMLLVSTASLADLNERLQQAGREALPMNRFRPNIVIDGIGPFDEDYASAIRIGAAELKPVKPCPRCPMPAVDQATGVPGPDPQDILMAYRQNPKVDNAVTFGMNVALVAGDGLVLRVGDEVGVELAF